MYLHHLDFRIITVILLQFFRVPDCFGFFTVFMVDYNKKDKQKANNKFCWCISLSQGTAKHTTWNVHLVKTQISLCIHSDQCVCSVLFGIRKASSCRQWRPFRLHRMCRLVQVCCVHEFFCRICCAMALHFQHLAHSIICGSKTCGTNRHYFNYVTTYCHHTTFSGVTCYL